MFRFLPYSTTRCNCNLCSLYIALHQRAALLFLYIAPQQGAQIFTNIKWVNFLKDIGWTAEDIVKDLTKGVEGYPKGLQPEEYDSSNACAFYIHEEQKAINALNIEVLELELNQEKQYEYPQDRQKQHERDYDKEQYQISDQLEDWKYL